MDMPTRLELEKLVEQLRANLPDAEFEAAAAIITHAIMLIERGVDGQRQAARAERELLEQQERAVEADRRALFEERKELDLARAALDKEHEAAGVRRAADEGLQTLTSALQSENA